MYFFPLRYPELRNVFLPTKVSWIISLKPIVHTLVINIRAGFLSMLNHHKSTLSGRRFKSPHWSLIHPVCIESYPPSTVTGSPIVKDSDFVSCSHMYRDQCRVWLRSRGWDRLSVCLWTEHREYWAENLADFTPLIFLSMFLCVRVCNTCMCIGRWGTYDRCV